MDTQQILTLGIVAVAGLSLGRRMWLQAKGTAEGDACGGCGGGCGKPVAPKPAVRPAPQATQLVTLSVGAPPTRRFTPPKPSQE